MDFAKSSNCCSTEAQKSTAETAGSVPRQPVGQSSICGRGVATFPPDISKLNGISKVCEFNGKVATPLPQILDCPTGWRGTEPAVSAVDFCASVEQQLDDFAKSIKRRVVKSGCARFVVCTHKFAVFVQNRPDLVHITQLYGFDQFV